MSVRVRIQKLHPAAALPSRQTKGSAGFDLTAIEDTMILAGGRGLVRTGLAIALPRGYEAQVRPRSGLALRHGVSAHFGTIDSDYRGEILVLLHNFGAENHRITAGERIAQMVVAPVADARFVEMELDDTERGPGGFGHTGR